MWLILAIFCLHRKCNFCWNIYVRKTKVSLACQVQSRETELCGILCKSLPTPTPPPPGKAFSFLGSRTEQSHTLRQLLEGVCPPPSPPSGMPGSVTEFFTFCPQPHSSACEKMLDKASEGAEVQAGLHTLPLGSRKISLLAKWPFKRKCWILENIGIF